MPLAESSLSEAWLGPRRASLSALLANEELRTDPWGNCYVVNPTTLVVLSAGPNGIIESPFTSSPFRGDDVGAAIK